MVEENKSIAIIEKYGIMPVEHAKAIADAYDQFIKAILKENTDYGKVPGTDKPTLYKPGAEKLNQFRGFVPDFELVKEIEDWEKGLFYYSYKCILRKSDGTFIASSTGSANSKESKWAFRWVFASEVPTEFDKKTLKSKSGISKKGKPYQLFRVPNQDIYDQVNTIKKMAQKRAYVGATLLATATSDRFTQDMEDLPETDKPVEEADYEEVKTNNTNGNLSKKELGERLLRLWGNDKQTAKDFVAEWFKKELKDLTPEECIKLDKLIIAEEEKLQKEIE